MVQLNRVRHQNRIFAEAYVHKHIKIDPEPRFTVKDYVVQVLMLYSGF
jgi:hypothetical protein